MKNRYSLPAVRLAALPLGIAAALVPFASLAQSQSPSDVHSLDRIEVTGSRIKRADVEGAVPVTVIDRAAIDASGHVSVADVLRDTTFASFGNFSPRSGSSAQAVSDVDLRGIGSDRTLVLIDGRRAPYAPSLGTNADLNTIPLAAVERIEILSDGASALYGSDAIGGVVNVILRKDFDGAEVRIGKGTPSVTGGDTDEASVLFGISGERGNLMFGASYNSRGIVFARDQLGGDIRGGSPYGNNFYFESATEPGEEGEAGGALPGYACNDPNFWMNEKNCVYDYNAEAANEASIKNKSLFARGTLQLNDAVSLYSAASYSHASSFGRYAPTPGVLYVPENSPNDPVPGDGRGAFVYHRYAAAGNRDTFVDNTVLDINLGMNWQVSDRLSIDAGLRRSDARLGELGRGYIVTPLAEAAAADGRYNLRDPFGNAEDVIKGFTTTTSRDGKFVIEEAYANASLDLFDMAGGRSAVAFGVESRSEDYADIYDSLSEAGVVAGSAGNSAAGSRRVHAAYAEWLLPVMDRFDFTLAARYDRYSDYGGDLSPKASLRWQPLPNLTLRASAGKGFRAPTLNNIHAKRSFSAEQVQDYRTCLAMGYSAVDCGGDANNDGIADGPVAKNVSYQVDTWYSGNPDLGSEHSRQYSLGLAWDPLDWLNATLDYYHIQIDNRIRLIEYQELVDFDNNGLPLPSGTKVERRSNGSIRQVETAFANEGDLTTRGLDLNLRGSFQAAGWGKLDSWLQLGRVLEFKVTDGTLVKDRLGWVTAPEMRGSLRNAWTRGNWSLNWNANYIGAQKNPSVKPSFGFFAGDPDTRVGSYVTHDLALTYKTPWNAGITLGSNNVGDRYPAEVEVSSRPWNFNLYNGYGRILYMRYTQKF
ncbi:MAG: TonB-dependent receptor [Stenotrophomonas nitritireducens]|uniref:TonB-dependent receptor plug domain-containing protein n=1 Tax=Stenotrophomonas nitritireducens TaxID=83617 RepID=UPI001ACC6C40|nr:TonB-dependent receptor [Stenotrophomonas nitritireducens]MBN8792700.1 TonB-dependent receptor [Stenotrophomonas nitritireducens]MBN8797460.1 TonB-dependent receptor [Stenotrophomonas nitritireducens]